MSRGGRGRLVPPAVGIGPYIQRCGLAQGLSLAVLHRDDLCGVRIDHQLDLLPGQFIGHFKALSLVAHGAVLAYLAREPVIEQLIQPGGPVAQAADTG